MLMNVRKKNCKILKKFFNKIRYKLGLYDLREEGRKWVVENFGREYEQEFLQKYDDINRGIPIGGLLETRVFLAMIETIKKETVTK